MRYFYNLLFIMLTLWTGKVLSHVSGFTDSSIQVSQQGVKIIYTLPTDNLLESPFSLSSEAKGDSSKIPKEPIFYKTSIVKAWQVVSKGRKCFLNPIETNLFDELKIYQYILTYRCLQGMDTLKVTYHLPGKQWRGHVNYSQIFVSDQQMRMRFTFDKQQLNLPIKELLEEWNTVLSAGFLPNDPNHKFNVNVPEGPIETPSNAMHEPNWHADPQFVLLGTKHILQGWDHVLFIIALLLIPASMKRLFLLVSLFTLAHSITLALAYYQVFSLQPSITEPLIALTVLIIGCENIWLLKRRQYQFPYRALTVFVFGLIHGIGFSYLLSSSSISGAPMLGRLLYFNFGVELGQLCIVLLLWLPLNYFIKKPAYSTAAKVFSALIAGAGFISLMARLFS